MAKKIVSLVGTSRPGNFTSKAMNIVHQEIKSKGIDLEILEASKLSLNFPGEGETEDAIRLQKAVQEASGVLIGTPEYHGTFSAKTKLLIENMGFPSRLSGKPVAILGVAAGRIGAIKSIEQLKGVLSHVGAMVVPRAVSIAGIQAMFDEDGNCKNPEVEKALKSLALELDQFITTYVCTKKALENAVRKHPELMECWSTEV